MKWEKVKLGEIALCITKGTTPSNVGDTFVKQGIKYIRSELISSSRRISDEGLLYISELTHQKLSRSQLQENDILFSIAGVYLGKTALLRKTDIPANTNQAVGIIRLDNKKCCINYIYYYLNLRSVVNYINRLSSQAAQPNINLTQLSNISIFLPPLPIQERIADILSAYDDLIENNQKQIKLLEEAAQRLYKEWFVDFRFPGHETTPIVDGIPEGWEKKKMEGIAYFTRGKIITKEQTKFGNVPVVAGGLTPAYFHNESNAKAPVITISASGANAGYVKLYLQDIWASDCSFVDSRMSQWILYVYCVLMENRHRINAMKKGSAQPHVYAKDINSLDILIPTKDLLAKFIKMASGYYEKIKILQQEIARLKEARDRLLPKLMSGEIDVMAKAKKEMPSDRFDHIRRHWENVPYDPNQFALAARADGQLTEEEVKIFKDIAEEE